MCVLCVCVCVRERDSEREGEREKERERGKGQKTERGGVGSIQYILSLVYASTKYASTIMALLRCYSGLSQGSFKALLRLYQGSVYTLSCICIY